MSSLFMRQPELDAANAAGGKDNISVVYVEGERFAPTDGWAARPVGEISRRGEHPAGVEDGRRKSPSVRGTNTSRATRLAAIVLAAGIVAAALGPWPLGAMFQRSSNAAAGVPAATIAVGPTESIARALERAGAGFAGLDEAVPEVASPWDTADSFQLSGARHLTMPIVADGAETLVACGTCRPWLRGRVSSVSERAAERAAAHYDRRTRRPPDWRAVG